MGQKMKSVSLVSIMMLSVLSTLLMATVTVSANTVVITEAIQVVDGGTAADQQAAVSADSEGNVHVVWTRNNLHLYYSMISPRGETLIDTTQITNPGLHKIWHPDMVVDDLDRIHIVWTDKASQHKIVYTVLNPWAAPMDGSASDDGTLSAIDDHVVPCALRTATGQQSISIAKETLTLFGRILTTSFNGSSTNLKFTTPCSNPISPLEQLSHCLTTLF